MKLLKTNTALMLLATLTLIGCAEKAPYDEVQTPDEAVIEKSRFTMGEEEIRLDQPILDINGAIADTQGQVQAIEAQIAEIQAAGANEGDPVVQIQGLMDQKGDLQSQLQKYKQIQRARGTEFLFLVSTLGAPRQVSSQMPYFQGKETIVKMRFEEDGLKVYQAERDNRFNDNALNESPIMTIPGEHVDFRCAENDLGECTNKEEKNEDISWTQRRWFIPDFDELELEATNELKIFNSDFCFKEAKQVITDYELTPDVLNIKVERSFEMKDSWICKILHIYEIAGYSLERSAFKTQFMYSMVRLNKLESPNYKPVNYPVPDHRNFGFFKNKIQRLKGDFDSSRPETIYYLNRFNPDNGKVVYHLSASFNKPENLYLRDATHASIARMNQSLTKANAGIQIELVNAPSLEEEKKSGDLRYNTIVLIDEPLSNGLLGYGPSVSHPRTGEILQAHTNMYSGVLRSGVRRTYDAMARFQKDEAKELAAQAAANDPNAMANASALMQMIEAAPKRGGVEAVSRKFKAQSDVRKLE